MGYNTYFRGNLQISPCLNDEIIQQFIDFKSRSATLMEDSYETCNWEFLQHNDFTVMQWDGEDKSYKMDLWAEYLRKTYFPYAKISGVVFARGENFFDIWHLSQSVTDNTITKVNGWPPSSWWPDSDYNK